MIPWKKIQIHTRTRSAANAIFWPNSTVIWTNCVEWRKYSGKAEQAFFWVLHSLKIPILFLKISYIQRRFSAEAMPKFKKIYKCTMLLTSRCIFVSQTSLKSKEYKIISLFIQNYRTDTSSIKWSINLFFGIKVNMNWIKYLCEHLARFMYGFGPALLYL